MSLGQRTLAKRVSVTGVGLHTGQPATVSLGPGAPDSGFVFVRADLPGQPEISARAEQVCDTAFATTLGAGEARVGTVEHVLAALAGMGLHNARIEVVGPEVPILDGSAAGFCALIRTAGICEQARPRRVLVVRHAVELREGDKLARLLPAERFAIRCSIEFPDPAIGFQVLAIEPTPELFERELAPARTFGFLREVQQLQAQGLGRGGSLENAVVLDAGRVLNPGGLRFPDELVRHKVLDALGDLAVLGLPLRGRLELHKSGHALHHRLLQALVSQPAAFSVEPARDAPDWQPHAAAGAA